MKIGLMGCEFVSPNKGCEALTYSIISILNDYSPLKENTTIYNFSNTRLGSIKERFPNFKFINVKTKIKDLRLTYIRALHDCDIILDATMGDSFSDIYSKEYFKRLAKNKLLAEFLCKNYILLPQTYGPFEDDSRKIAIKILKKAKKIYCRDKMSLDIVEKDFKINNTELVTDMAFFLPYDSSKYNIESKKIKVGINVSGLLYKGGFNSLNQFDLTIDYKNYIEKVIKYFSNNPDYQVYLIPHVIDLSENAHDDDYAICEKLAKKIENCILAPVFTNPIDAKSYISNMDIFIGSRMHSTIAAFSAGVLTIPVSYSRKFEGLFNSLEYEYVINGKTEDSESAFNKTLQYIENRKELLETQKKSQKLIEDKKKSFIISLEKVIENR